MHATDAVAGRRALAPDARPEVGLVQHVGEHPQQERAGTDGALAPRTGPLTWAHDRRAE
jgi:hypothetical protein